MNFQKSRGIIFINTHCKNKFSDLKEEEKETAFRAEFVRLKVEKGKTNEQANSDFENLGSKRDYQFNAIMSDSVWENAESRGELAVRLLTEQLNIPRSNIDIFKNLSKK